MFICDISVFNRYGKQTLDDQLLPLKVNWQSLVTILVIEQVPGISQNRLIPFLQTDKANVSKLLKEMEGEGLIERHTDPTDQRNKVCHLTLKGQTLAPKLSEALESWEKALFQDVDPKDLEAFHRVSTVITQNLVKDWNPHESQQSHR